MGPVTALTEYFRIFMRPCKVRGTINSFYKWKNNADCGPRACSHRKFTAEKGTEPRFEPTSPTQANELATKPPSLFQIC